MGETSSASDFVIDACALIDFYTACPEVLTLISRHMGRLVVADVVLAEVAELEPAEAVELGVTLATDR